MFQGLYLVGALAAVIAGYFGFCGFSMDTAVASGPAGETVANLQLMHIQALNFALAIGAGIMACILIGAGAVVEAIRKSRRD